jgi:hypothetical protein
MSASDVIIILLQKNYAIVWGTERGERERERGGLYISRLNFDFVADLHVVKLLVHP